MKKLLIAILCCTTSLVSFGQDHLEELSYEDSQNPEIFREIRNGTTLSRYIAADGSVLKLGDTLIIGTPSGNTMTATAGGIGMGASFSTIIMGRPAGVGNIWSSVVGYGKAKADQEMQGQIVVISEMKLSHKGSRKKPLELQILLGEPNGRAFGINKYMSVTDYENSVLVGEIRSKNAPLSREEAIAKLKESKELVELGILSQEEYEVLKTELTPIIMAE